MGIVGKTCRNVFCLEGIDKEGVVIEHRIRVKLSDLSAYLTAFDQNFLEVYRKAGVKILRFIIDAGAHFNLIFLLKFQSLAQMRELHADFGEAYAKLHGLKDPKDAKAKRESLEKELDAMVEDNERSLLIGFSNDRWN